jgi:hypothetical protein
LAVQIRPSPFDEISRIPGDFFINASIVSVAVNWHKQEIVNCYWIYVELIQKDKNAIIFRFLFCDKKTLEVILKLTLKV